MGRLSPSAPRGYFDQDHRFCDVAVIGGGPAGLAAAEAAVLAGAETVLVEDEPELGGALRWGRFPGETEAFERADALRRELLALPRLSVLTAATCTGLFADRWLAVIHAHRLTRLRAHALVLATGCVEQPMVFRNNDLPGVMLASAVQRAMRLWAVEVGRQAVVVTANPEGYAAALDLLDAGATLKAVLDLRPMPSACAARDELLARGVRVRDGWTVTAALPGRAGPRLEAVVIDRITGEGATAGDGVAVACDLLVTSAGLAPLGQLACGAGARFVYDDALASFRLEGQPEGVWLAGSVAHRHNLAAVLADGAAAGTAAAGGVTGPTGPAECHSHAWPIFPHADGKDFVDLDEDQTAGDLRNALAEGFDDPELAKRYTTIAMGPSQGRHSAVNALRILRRSSPLGADAVGATTTQRPPFLPESFGHLAGRSVAPTRLTAMHHQHLGLGLE